MMYPMGKILKTISTNTDFICIYTANASATQNGVAVHKRKQYPCKTNPNIDMHTSPNALPPNLQLPPSLPAHKTTDGEDDDQQGSRKWLRDRRKWLNRDARKWDFRELRERLRLSLSNDERPHILPKNSQNHHSQPT